MMHGRKNIKRVYSFSLSAYDDGYLLYLQCKLL